VVGGWTIWDSNPGISKIFFCSPNVQSDTGAQGISVLIFGGKRVAEVGEINHSSPSSVEVKSEWRPTYFPHIRLRGVERKNVTFAFKGT
jgi:hypothetical protein